LDQKAIDHFIKGKGKGTIQDKNWIQNKADIARTALRGGSESTIAFWQAFAAGVQRYLKSGRDISELSKYIDIRDTPLLQALGQPGAIEALKAALANIKGTAPGSPQTIDDVLKQQEEQAGDLAGMGLKRLGKSWSRFATTVDKDPQIEGALGGAAAVLDWFSDVGERNAEERRHPMSGRHNVDIVSDNMRRALLFLRNQVGGGYGIDSALGALGDTRDTFGMESDPFGKYYPSAFKSLLPDRRYMRPSEPIPGGGTELPFGAIDQMPGPTAPPVVTVNPSFSVLVSIAGEQIVGAVIKLIKQSVGIGGGDAEAAGAK
jgi:hypothetical protein